MYFTTKFPVFSALVYLVARARRHWFHPVVLSVAWPEKFPGSKCGREEQTVWCIGLKTLPNLLNSLSHTFITVMWSSRLPSPKKLAFVYYSVNARWKSGRAVAFNFQLPTTVMYSSASLYKKTYRPTLWLFVVRCTKNCISVKKLVSMQ